MRWNPSAVPKRSSSGWSPRVNSTVVGMSCPVSGPKRSRVGVWWLRWTPGCNVMTSPSSVAMRAISTSM